MENVTTKKRELAPVLMARVDACAYIFMANRPEKIGMIMENRKVDALEAARIYTIGALKAAKRRGTAKNYREALDNLEAEQVGDRGNPLTRTISADNTARTVQSISSINHYGTTAVYREGFTVGPDGTAMKHLFTMRGMETPEKTQAEKRTHTRNTGRILGSMYTDIEYRQELLDPVYDARDAVVEKNMTVFFREYVSRLSRTVKTRLTGLVRYIHRESDGDMLKADRIIKALTSSKGEETPETYKMAKFVDNLHRSFEHKDSITRPEFMSLLYKYGDLIS